MNFDQRNQLEELQNKVGYLWTVTQQLNQATDESIENYKKFEGIDLTPVFSTPHDLLEVVLDYELQIKKMLDEILQEPESNN